MTRRTAATISATVLIALALAACTPAPAPVNLTEKAVTGTWDAESGDGSITFASDGTVTADDIQHSPVNDTPGPFDGSGTWKLDGSEIDVTFDGSSSTINDVPINPGSTSEGRIYSVRKNGTLRLYTYNGASDTRYYLDR